jgi:hypothetical protein
MWKFVLCIAGCLMLLTACIDDTPVQRVDSPPILDAEQPSTMPATADLATEAPNEGTVGDTLERGGIYFTFESVERFIDDSDSVFFADVPDDGYEFILMWFAIRNDSDEDYFVNMWHEASYLDGFSISSRFLFFNVDGEIIWGNVSAGRARRGYIGFEVPLGWRTLEFRYRPWFVTQDGVLIFSVTSDCI